MKALMVLLVLCCLPLVYGQLNKKDDIEFAKRLARLGYDDLADELVAQISKFGKREDRQRSKELRCTLLQESASRILDLEEKQEKFDKVVECYERLATDESGIRKLQLTLTIADVLVSRSQELIEVTKGTEKQEEAYRKSSVFLQKALGLFEDAKNKTDRAGSHLLARNDSAKEQERAEKAGIRYHAWYGICRCYYFLGLCAGANNLETCKTQLEAYIWEYEGRIGAYYGMLLNGLVLHELKNFEESIFYYDGVYRPLQGENHPVAQDLTLQACYYKAKTLVEWKKFADAIKLVDEFKGIFKKASGEELLEQGYGQAAVLEMGKAYVGQGDYQKAIDLAQTVATQPTYWSHIAKKLLLEWGKLNPESLQDAKNAYLVASGLWRESKYQKAILAYMQVIEYAKNKADIERYALDSWEKIGQAFWILGLYQESAACYEICATKYKDYRKIVENVVDGKSKTQEVEIAAKAAYWAYRGYRQNYQITGDKEDEKRAQKMQKYLLDNWRDTPYGYNLSYTDAEQIVAKAEQQKDPFAAAKGYVTAAKAYQKVHKRADSYERALVNIGTCYYKAARRLVESAKKEDDKARAKKLRKYAGKYFRRGERELLNFHRYISKNKISEVEVERRNRRNEAMAESLFYLGRIYLQLNKREKAAKALEQLRRDYPAQGEMFAGATFLLVKARINDGQLDKAEALVKEMEERQVGAAAGTMATYQSYSYFLLGRQYSERADETEQQVAKLETGLQDDPTKRKIASLREKYRDDFYKGAGYMAEWLKRRENAKLEDIDPVASKLALMARQQLQEGREKDARTNFRRALSLFRRCLAMYKGDDKDFLLTLQQKTAECAIETGDWEQALYVFYPIFHRDRSEREAEQVKKSPIKSKKDYQISPEYVNYISQILTSLAQLETYENPRQLYTFLCEYARYDLLSENGQFFEARTTPADAMYQKYQLLKFQLAWIDGEVFGDAERKKLDEQYKTEQKELEGLTREQIRNKKLRELQFVYQDRYLQEIDKVFPAKGRTQIPSKADELRQRIQRLCAFLAYEHVYLLVDRLPRYQDSRLNWGRYDNPAWWEAKYRQCLLLYLQGMLGYKGQIIDSGRSVEALREQQPHMGGTEYEKKFGLLLNKIHSSTEWKQQSR